MLPSACSYVDCKAGGLRESFLTRESLESTSESLFGAALSRFFQYMPRVNECYCAIVPDDRRSIALLCQLRLNSVLMIPINEGMITSDSTSRNQRQIEDSGSDLPQRLHFS